MSELPAPETDPGRALLSLYDTALPEVYGYLVARCGSRQQAEDLTSEVFLAAVRAVQRGTVDAPTVPWLIAVARHKLIDHWRAAERDRRRSTAVGDAAATALAATRSGDDWDVRLDVMAAHETLARLGAHHRGALTLRYLDGLPVREVAAVLGRSVGATEVLLVRARTAFRAAHEFDHRREEGS